LPLWCKSNAFVLVDDSGMVIAMTPSEIAEQFLELFSKKERWTSGPYAIDETGAAVKVDSQSACAWCLYGAWWRARLAGKISLFDMSIFAEAIEDASRALYGYDAVMANEADGLPAVRAILRRVRDGK